MPVTKLTPPVGASGIFILSEPYASVIPGTAIDSDINAKAYTCIAVRRFTDIIESSSDVKAVYYDPYITDFTAEAFNDEVAANVSIVTLRSSDDVLYYVPDSYIASIPATLGHPYSDSYIVFRLHAHNLELDLTPVLSELSELILARTGIESTPTVMSSNNVTYVDESVHASYEDNRLNRVTKTQSVFDDLTTRETEVVLQSNVIEVLETETDRLRGLLDDNGISH